jgi:hypothetical protein
MYRSECKIYLGVKKKMGWEVFRGRQNRVERRKEPRVTLGKGAFYLNDKAFEVLERPAAVEMLYDGNRRIIGLRPIDPRKDNAFLLKEHRSNYKRIAAASFCTNYRLKYDRTLLFEGVDLNDDGVMMLDLGKTIEIGRGAR